MSRHVAESGGNLAGWWEDSRGFVAGHELKTRYHKATLALDRARRSLLWNLDADKVGSLSLEVDRCTEALDEVEKSVRESTFA